jgi:type II restriction enzyme
VTIDDLIKMYEDKRKQYGENAYKYISNLLSEAKEQHRKDFIKEGKKSDHEQSWRAFKGKNLEKLIEYIIKASVESLGLKIINGNVLERTEGKNLTIDLNKIKRNLLVDFGEYGYHLPDVDLVIYDPKLLKLSVCYQAK